MTTDTLDAVTQPPALQEAPRQNKGKTQSEILWQWIKDNPNQPTPPMREALKDFIPKDSLHTALSNLRERKMISVKKEPLEGSSRPVPRYTAVGETYEIKSITKDKKSTTAEHAKSKKDAPTAKATPEPQPQARPSPPTVRPITLPAGAMMTADFVMDNLSVREARLLYNSLREIFDSSAVLTQEAKRS